MNKLIIILLPLMILLLGCTETNKLYEKQPSDPVNETRLSDEDYYITLDFLRSVKEFNSHTIVFMERVNLDRSILSNNNFKKEYNGIFEKTLSRIENYPVNDIEDIDLKEYMVDFNSYNKELANIFMNMVKNEDVTYIANISESIDEWDRVKDRHGNILSDYGLEQEVYK